MPLLRVCPHYGGPPGKATVDTATDRRCNLPHHGNVAGLAVCRDAAADLDMKDERTTTGAGTVAPRALSGTALAALNARPAAERSASSPGPSTSPTG
ncbi:hypothetical protein OG933_43605 [Streptomyces sp. NBC_00016]|uniref:hypothetical protein n=1 Tax=Streptomyces sp. NBC_00016 TaxID=2975622 RepID=UPI0032552117